MYKNFNRSAILSPCDDFLTCSAWRIFLLFRQDKPGKGHAVGVHRLHGSHGDSITDKELGPESRKSAASQQCTDTPDSQGSN